MCEKDVFPAQVEPDTELKREEQALPKDSRELTLIDPEMFFDLLMEQQEQM